MTRLDDVLYSALKKAGETATSLQRQAPAARMIGEFAVKQLIKEVEKISQRFSPTSHEPSTKDQ